MCFCKIPNGLWLQLYWHWNVMSQCTPYKYKPGELCWYDRWNSAPTVYISLLKDFWCCFCNVRPISATIPLLLCCPIALLLLLFLTFWVEHEGQPSIAMLSLNLYSILYEHTTHGCFTMSLFELALVLYLLNIRFVWMSGLFELTLWTCIPTAPWQSPRPDSVPLD